MKDSKKSFEGKEVFVGIDVHARKYMVSCVVEGERVCGAGMPGDPEAVVKYLERTFGGAKVRTVYEAGFSGFVLHRRLLAAGYENIVVNPASIEHAPNDRVKTDRKDATRLAVHLSQGRLKGIYVPTEEEERARLLSRTRGQLVEHRTGVMNQIRMKLRQFGVILSDYMKVLRRSEVQALVETQPEELRVVVSALLSIWEAFDQEIEKLNIELRKQADKDPKEVLYRSIPGIGPVGARTLANELGDMSRFRNERELASFVGLTPSEYSSGDKVRRGNISRQGSGRIRAVLTEAAWAAVKKDPVLTEVYNRIRARAGAKRAIIAIARRLLVRAKALFRTGELYELGRGQAEAA